MLFPNWFNRQSASVDEPRPAAGSPAALSANVPSEPAPDKPLPQAQAPVDRAERMQRREALYAVVREVMRRAWVLAAGYKFKVLSIDPSHRQFLVMIDLARGYGGESICQNEIAALIAQTAKTRSDILVTAVYWRIDDREPVGPLLKDPPPQGAEAPLPVVGQPPAGVAATVARAAEPALPDPPAAAPSVAPCVLPSPSVLIAGRPKQSRSLNGFEDTLHDARDSDLNLSNTQYGELG
ncbi:hypothetical protein D8B23_04745 [Verminephrobacter aporrectodeae subsp. tuberculatae]|uniref:hypothetical protein n=1 Tax=Verminephrobacter aporrectodeae TaxID=1110389 RepID=UPI0022441C16|nr:hypothetical protein [Verminephrobacter aporrectodeae]MCW8197741.1 hypothetical protein [Verminephrobacter aporrectodeae subsp. tuberculatae]